MKGEIIYHLNCGCIAKRKDLVRMKDGLACKKHKARVADRKQKCKTCKILFSIGRHKSCSGATKVVAEVKKPVKKKRIQKSREYYALRKWDTHWRGSYCRTLPVCVSKGLLECDTCKEMWPIFKGVDPGIKGIWK